MTSESQSEFAEVDKDSVNLDITQILRGWHYQPEHVTVRKIQGADGKPKVQMRLPMGLIQMDLEGRPDGLRPKDYDSYLEYYEACRHDNPESFALDSEDCSRLRDEATMYYHRYLSLFHLGDHKRVVRDTERNLRCLDFIKHFADSAADKISLEQYRPYILMIHARAHANASIEGNLRAQALAEIREGIKKIEAFLREVDREELIEHSGELSILRKIEAEIREKLPEAKIEDLREEMQKTINTEDYERAAQLRDEIRRLEELL